MDNLLLARAEYGVVFMRDGNNAYYNSKLTEKCRELGDRDLLRECLDEARKHGMPIIAYCQVQYATNSWNAHPEWRMKDGGRKRHQRTTLLQLRLSGVHQATPRRDDGL